MISYTGSGGSITSLAQLGVEFTQQGTLTFDSSALAGLSQTQISDALTFLGDPNSGGFLQFANNTLNSITDPITGVVATETQTLQNQNQNDQTRDHQRSVAASPAADQSAGPDGAGQCADRVAAEPEHVLARAVPVRYE